VALQRHIESVVVAVFGIFSSDLAKKQVKKHTNPTLAKKPVL